MNRLLQIPFLVLFINSSFSQVFELKEISVNGQPYQLRTDKIELVDSILNNQKVPYKLYRYAGKTLYKFSYSPESSIKIINSIHPLVDSIIINTLKDLNLKAYLQCNQDTINEIGYLILFDFTISNPLNIIDIPVPYVGISNENLNLPTFYELLSKKYQVNVLRYSILGKGIRIKHKFVAVMKLLKKHDSEHYNINSYRKTSRDSAFILCEDVGNTCPPLVLTEYLVHNNQVITIAKFQLYGGITLQTLENAEFSPKICEKLIHIKSTNDKLTVILRTLCDCNDCSPKKEFTKFEPIGNALFKINKGDKFYLVKLKSNKRPYCIAETKTKSLEPIFVGGWLE